MRPLNTLFTATLFALVLFSCKKNDAGEPEPEPPVIEELKPEEVTQSISVHYGKLVTGNFPAASASGPQLDASSNNQSGLTYSGGYIIIQPDLVGEGVAGYHLKITGDDKKYFNIDFSNPASGRLQKVQFNRSNFRSPANLKQMDDNPDYDDSSIVIKLNEAFKPGTFCVEYQAYDFNGNIGNLIKYCVTVLEPGNDKRFVGKWQLKRYKKEQSPRDGGTNNAWADPALMRFEVFEYTCENDKLRRAYSSDSDNLLISSYIVKYNIMELTLHDNGNFEYHEQKAGGIGGEGEFLDLENSSCTDFVYKGGGGLEFWEKGGWTYNATTKQLLLITLELKSNGTVPTDMDWHYNLYINELTIEDISEDTMTWTVKKHGFSSAFYDGDGMEFKK